MCPAENANQLSRMWGIAICLLLFAFPATAQETFGTRFRELTEARANLLVSAANGTMPIDAQSIALGAELELGNPDATTVLMLYTDVACDHCEAALQAIDEQLQLIPEFLASRRIIFRHSGSLLDGLIVGCIAQQSGSRYPSTFRLIQREKPAEWSVEKIEELMRLSGLSGDAADCLTTPLLEKIYADFADLMSICEQTGCRLTEGTDQQILVPLVPQLIVGRASADGSRLAIERTLVGQHIAPFIDGL